MTGGEGVFADKALDCANQNQERWKIQHCILGSDLMCGCGEFTLTSYYVQVGVSVFGLS